MASAPFRIGLRMFGASPGGNSILSPKSKLIEIRAAFISGKALRTEDYPKPKPWPYKERGYRNRHAIFDGTLKRLDENSKVILVEGPPGIGKTQLAKSIAEELEFEHFPMITMDNYYINAYGYDLRQLDSQLPPRLQSFDISKFIKNPKADRAVFLQFAMYHLKYMQYVDALAHLLNTGQGVVLERSVYSDSVFADTMLSLGYMSKKEKEEYDRFKDSNIGGLMKPHLVIYLDVSPETVVDNLKKRGKGEENVFNKDFLEKLEHNYKQNFLKTISEHAELLIYDWSTPGESEIVVEDIERIDFERFEQDKHDPKMNDWRLKEDWDWCEKRWEYTHNRDTIVFGLLHHYVDGCPNLDITGEESAIYEKIWGQAPGQKYAPGYNEDMGDTGILWKYRIPMYPDLKKNKPVPN